MKSRAGAAMLVAASGAFFIAPAQAQTFPNRALRLVIPFAPGGTADIIGRPLAQKMAEAVGQPVVVENRGGAGGAVGAAIVASAAPDGYTLLLGVNGFLTILPGFTRLPYDPVTDFSPVATIASSPSRQEAAKRLGISPRTLRYKLAQMREMGLPMSPMAQAA